MSIIEQTHTEFLEQMKKHKCCGVVRPTGLGKTRMFSEYARNKRTLFVVPRRSLALDMKRRFDWLNSKDCTFVTYHKLLSIYKSQVNFKDTFGDLDFICLDEMHRAGAETWLKAVTQLISEYRGIDIAGGSATPVRCDGKNVVDILFKGIQLTEYTLVDAIKDKILPRPRYVVSSYDIKSEYIKIQKIKLRDDIDTSDLRYSVLTNFKRFETELNISEIIRSNVPDINRGMRFICFFSDINTLKKQRSLVKNWFEEAFPKHSTTCYTVHTGLKHNDATLKEFSSWCSSREVRVLFSVDMISEGIHIKGTTGVVLLRKTNSHILFSQQIGRCMELNTDGYTPVIFDFVNNIGNSYKFNLTSNLERDLYAVSDTVDYTKPIQAEFERMHSVAKVSYTGKLPLDQQKRIIDLALNNVPIQDISVKLCMSRDKVSSFLSRVGVVNSSFKG